MCSKEISRPDLAQNTKIAMHSKFCPVFDFASSYSFPHIQKYIRHILVFHHTELLLNVVHLNANKDSGLRSSSLDPQC